MIRPCSFGCLRCRLLSVERLERVLWRVRKRNKDKSVITNLELKRAIMYECGTDDRTIYMNRKALKTLGWIKPRGTKKIELTDEDLTGEG